MEFSADSFDGFLAKIGNRFAWRQASACPCINPASGAARPNCKFCRGKGQQWGCEVPGIAGVTNQAQQKGIAAFGTWEPGDAVLTIPEDSPLYAAGQYDRFRALNATSRFSMHRIRGENDFVFGTIVTVDRVFWLNDAGDAIIEGGTPTWDADGNFTWANGAPPDGKPYSVSGTRYVEYFAYLSLPSPRNLQQGTPLPKKLLARQFDLYGR